MFIVNLALRITQHGHKKRKRFEVSLGGRRLVGGGVILRVVVRLGNGTG